MPKKKSIAAGALILTAASIITRLLGFVYRIYLTNEVGAEGIGLYQLIMPIYSLAWSICCSGFSVVVSKIVAQENIKGESGNMGRALKTGLIITGIISAAVAGLIFFLSPVLAGNLYNDPRIELSFKILSFAIPFMSIGSCIRGYFLGLHEPSVPAVSQVLEQLVRMGAAFVLGGTFLKMGLEYACAACVIGILAGEVLSMLYVAYSYGAFKKRRKLTKHPTIGAKAMTAMIFSMAMPLTLNRISGSLLSAVENILIPTRLQAFGLTQAEAISQFGRITGMAFPLIFFPSALLMALATTLVPAVAEAVAVKNLARVNHMASRVFFFSAVIGAGAAAIFAAIPYELGFAIYKQDISEMLFILAFMCPLWYLNITFSGILNGLGEQLLMFKNGIVSSVINILFIWFLVPAWGVHGFIAGWFVGVLYVLIRSVRRIKSRTSMDIDYLKWFAKPTLAAIATGLCAKQIARHIIFPAMQMPVGVAVIILITGSVYMFFILLLKCVTAEDLRTVFKGFLAKKEFTPKDKSTL